MRRGTQWREFHQEGHWPKRRWFGTPGVDLIVWLDDFNRPFGFQWCYRRDGQEFALQWENGRGFSHFEVDDGEEAPLVRKRTPMLTNAASFDPGPVRQSFKELGDGLPEVIRNLVDDALESYPRSPVSFAQRPLQRVRPPELPRVPWWKFWAW